MTESMSSKDDFFSENDALDINELASLNEDISAEFIEQLQNKVSQSVAGMAEKDDSLLFEEVEENTKEITPKNTNLEDDFIKKYKAKQNKQNLPPAEQSSVNEEKQENIINETNTPVNENIIETVVKTEDVASIQANNTNINNEINNLTSGNIIEKPLNQEQINYNASLDYIDDNTKYSKYVIYISPENKEFIESLTVKERKNLINRIIREQDDIAITKKRLGIIQTFIKHTIIAIITIAISIPVIYHTINASLEASINNYRRSQTIFKTLYKEKGKIQKMKNKTY